MWTLPTQVTQQAVSEHLRTFPAKLFLRALLEILPLMQGRWRQRQRPVSEDLAQAHVHYAAVLVLQREVLWYTSLR